jgi:hypothetical protein
MGRRLTVAFLAAGLLAAPATAQRAGGMEFGVLGSYTLFDASLQLDDAAGFGGRVGLYVAPKWLVEFTYSSTPADGPAVPSDTKYEPFSLRLNFVEPFSTRGQMVVGLGYFFHYWGAIADAEDGLTGLAGLRFDLVGPWFARIDGTADLALVPQNGESDNWNLGLQAGIGLRLGGGQ